MKLEQIILFETAIDHLTGEELGMALEALNEMPEVLDALFLTGLGKKNRPAGLLQVMCRPESEIEVRDAIFNHTHALGIRRLPVERYALERFTSSLSVENESLPAKGHIFNEESYVRVEADAIKALAKKLGQGAPGIRFRKNID